MSTFRKHEKEFKGFYNNWRICREHPYHNRRMSYYCKPFNRFVGRHKRSGASYGCSLKQFDTKRAKVYNKFRDRTCVPYSFMMPQTVWWFGKSLNKTLGFNTKFKY